MAQADADRLKQSWNKSLFKTDGEEVELFKDVDFIEHGVKDAEVYYNSVNSLSENVDLSFLAVYIVHKSKEMLVYSIPTAVEFDLNQMKLRQYFKQVSVDTFKYDKTHYLLRLYLFRNLTYQTTKK